MAKIASGDYVGIKVVKAGVYAPQTNLAHELEKMARIQTTDSNIINEDETIGGPIFKGETTGEPLFGTNPFRMKSIHEAESAPNYETNLDITFDFDGVHDPNGVIYPPIHELESMDKKHSFTDTLRDTYSEALRNNDHVYIIMPDTNEDSTQEADRHYSWKCSSCWHRGTKWTSRKSVFRKCPNCDNTDPHTFRTSQIDARGNCKSMWAGGINEEPPKVNWKTIRCGHCGTTTRYLIKYPAKCDDCGRSL